MYDSDIGKQAYPALDIVVTRDGKIHIWADLPGVSAEEVKVYINGDFLVIEGHKESHYDSQFKVFHLSERAVAHFNRTLRLSSPVISDTFEYSLTDGVLHLCWQ
jgi:HSP20 family molecular chaperone IbpA